MLIEPGDNYDLNFDVFIKNFRIYIYIYDIFFSFSIIRDNVMVCINFIFSKNIIIF